MHPKFSYSNDNTSDAGLYTWDLGTDTLYADSALAELFGLDQLEAERGLPLTRYFERVHAEDQPLLAGAIRQAILTSQPFQESYRVHDAKGKATRILAFGKCFRDAQDEPRFYAGIVFPMPREQVDENGLLWQCLSAIEMAKRERRYDVAAKLLEAVRELDTPEQTVKLKLVHG